MSTGVSFLNKNLRLHRTPVFYHPESVLRGPVHPTTPSPTPGERVKTKNLSWSVDEPPKTSHRIPEHGAQIFGPRVSLCAPLVPPGDGSLIGCQDDGGSGRGGPSEPPPSP